MTGVSLILSIKIMQNKEIVPARARPAPCLGVTWFLRWLRRNAQRIVQSCKNGEGLPIQVYGDRDLFMQKRSNKPVYIDVAQERSQVFST